MRVTAIILAVTVLVTAQASHPRERRQYSNGADAAYRRDSRQQPSLRSPLDPIGELNRPADLTKNERRVKCPDGTRMPDGSTSVTLTYKDGHYYYPDGRVLLAVTQVICSQVYCANTCQNGGTCSAPDTCSCLSGYTGQFCETQIMYSDGPIGGEFTILTKDQRLVICPKGTRMHDNSTSVIMTYKDGDYFYPDGRILVGVHQLICSEGSAAAKNPSKPLRPVERKPSLTDRPSPLIKPTPAFETKYSCTPGCANGGQCVHTNTCSCPHGFWGKRCLTRVCTYPRFKSDLRAFLSGTLLRLKFECNPGLTTAAGRDHVMVQCREGYWILPDGKLMVEDDVRCY